MNTNYTNVEYNQTIERGNEHLYRLGRSPPSPRILCDTESSLFQQSDSDVEVGEQTKHAYAEAQLGQRRPSLVKPFSNELLSNARKSEIHPVGKKSILPMHEIEGLVGDGFCSVRAHPGLSPSHSHTSNSSYHTESQSVTSCHSHHSPLRTSGSPHSEVEGSGFQSIRHPSPMMGFEDLRTPEGSDDESLGRSDFLLGNEEPSFMDQLNMAEAQIRALDMENRLKAVEKRVKSLNGGGRPVLGESQSCEQADFRDRAFEKHKRLHDRKFNTRLFKTELCRSFTEFGFCPYGPRCQFAHGKTEIRNRPVLRHKKYKTIKCKNFQAGYCPYGSRCCFIHEEAGVELSMMTAPKQSKLKPELRGYHSMPLPVQQASE